jgi:hypothetical protein
MIVLPVALAPGLKDENYFRFELRNFLIDDDETHKRHHCSQCTRVFSTVEIIPLFIYGKGSVNERRSMSKVAWACQCSQLFFSCS